MKWLLWREYRHNLQLLVAGVVLLLLPYVFTLLLFLWPNERRASGEKIADGFITATVMSCAISQMTIALLGGNAIAGQRADRSAEFMAYMPVSRGRLIAGKLSLTAIVAAVIFGVTLLVFWFLSNWKNYLADNPYVLTFTAITGLVMFGVGWMLSSTQPSPTLAVCGGVVTPILIMLSLQLAYTFAYDEATAPNPGHFMATGFAIISLTLAAVCFSLGTWYYLQRVEP
jgi:ABC-type transport system involved in multi-copper enzyme maturation permease subunit